MNGQTLLFIVSLLLYCGCERAPEIGVVTGQLTSNGAPLEGVNVKFTPDPEEGNDGPNSSGSTDADGKYRLRFSLDPEVEGAVVGWHRIIVTDPAIEDRPPGKRRISSEYSSASKTPLKFEVTDAEQTFDADLDPPKRR